MMKKALSVIMTVCMLLGILPMTVLSENVEHVIMTAEDWAAFADDIAKGEGCADTWKLGADISVTANVVTNDYSAYPTVGTQAHPFAGTFDGQGHTLTVEIHDTYYRNEQTNPGAAPFRFIDGATIKNLTVTGYVSGPGHSAGLVSYNQNGSSLIENCTVYTDVIREAGANQRIGGVLGHNMTSTVTMKNVVYAGTLINSIYTHNIAGGLVGWSDRSTVILENCIFSGNFTGSVEAFSPILIQNPQIDSIEHNGMNVTYDKVYYTVEPSVTFDKYTIGQYVINDTVSRRVFEGLPENGIYEHIPGPDGKDYHIPCTVEGVQPNYRENADIDFTVKNYYGDVLTEQYYTVSLTKDGHTVGYIGSAGDYTFTLTGKNGYTGTFTKNIKVYDEVPYVDTDKTVQSVSSYTQVTPETDEWSYKAFINRGWYVVFGDVTIKNRITVSGNINLILCDGATLNAEKGIGVDQSSSLTIWVQSAGDGVINSRGDESAAGIGAYSAAHNDHRSCGDITINGGIINVQAGEGAGIGGFFYGRSGHVTINDGDVTARGTDGYPGIGVVEAITINNGTVTAYGGNGGAGIGGGIGDGAGNITVNGGIVNAYGGDQAAGIGSGYFGSDGVINISGGLIKAVGGPHDDGNATDFDYDIGSRLGNAIITFDYTDESADKMSVTAGVYVGTVKLKKTFYDAETLTKFAVTNDQDRSAIAGKTLIPAANVCTISLRCGLGSGEMPSVLKIKGDTYELPQSTFTPPSALRPFISWIVDTVEDEPVLMQPGDVITVTDNVRITAKYLSDYASLQSLIDSAEDGATITLEQDYVSDGEEDTTFVIPAGKTVTIDLAGNTVDRALYDAEAKPDGCVFTVYGTLTIKDSTAHSAGLVTGGNNTNAGGAFRVLEGGVLNIEGGVVGANRSTNGGAIYNNGVVSISGGVIENNSASNSGGAIFNNDAGVLNISGGRITGNDAAENYHGGGVHTSGTMNVSGDPIISGNLRGGEENNVGLYEGAVINVAGPLSDGASIGVNKSRSGSANSEEGVFTSGLPGNGTARVFKADSKDQHVLPYEGEASLYPSDVFFIEVVQSGNGTVVADKIYAKEGDRIGFISEADDGYRERSFTAADAAGNNVNVSFGTEKNWIYMPASDITVTVIFDPYYLINVDRNTSHGKIDLEWVWAYAGQKVPLNATPDKNHILSEWVVTDAEGNSVETADGGFIMPENNVTVSAVFEPIPNPAGPVDYVDPNGKDMTPVTAYTIVGPNTRLDTTGWYVVKDNVGVGRQIIYGDINIILCDGATLTVNKGIALDNGASLTVWSQKEGTGGLRVEKIAIEEAPGIHGFGNSIVTVNGGNIYAEGYKSEGVRFDDPSGGPGIYVKKLVINGGSVEAAGGWHAAGIGGGEGQSGETVIINGGYVKATGGLDGAGIGGGNGGHGGNITINGGTVDAVSGGSSAGIGGGYNGSGGNITVNGGTVVAAGYNGGAGIGGGRNGRGGNVTGGKIAFNGGNVKATSYYTGNQPSHGIGTGSGSNEADVTLSWTNENDSIYASSYGGTVRILKQFIDDEGNYHGTGTELTNGRSELYDSDINGRTLYPVTSGLSDVGGNDQSNSSSPQTGDDSHTGLWIMIMVISGLCAAALTVLLKRKKLPKTGGRI